MNRIINIIEAEVKKAFVDNGYDDSYAKVVVSNRPDLCEYQCNGAMAIAKKEKKNPFEIAEAVVKSLESSRTFEMIEAVKPGFINIKVSESFLTDYVNEMLSDPDRFGDEKSKVQKTIMLDYGGPNIAKPLHVGHLRSAVIGEAIKRMGIFCGNTVIGDVHMGDWGLQMGLVISELKERKPNLPYFDSSFAGEYPETPPFTLAELEEIYPFASAKSKEDEEFKKKALHATYDLQHGNRGYMALWRHIVNTSVADLKRNYNRLNVSFEMWKGESDVQNLIPGMVSFMKDRGFAYESEGALVVDVKEETDKKEVPPCMILKSDGASLYNTTDLATLLDRKNNVNPDLIIYVVDNRQDLYFTQVFRCAKKTGIVGPETELIFHGFGTMNGADGKPFKTRAGGVMRLESLLDEIEQQMYEKIMSTGNMSEEEAKETSAKIALSAVKYGDLSNQSSKDYVFDPQKFTSFEGNTGPYILYTIVRIKSILEKYIQSGGNLNDLKMKDSNSEVEKSLRLTLSRFNGLIEDAFEELAPHKLCAYIYELSNSFNRFYHETNILKEEDKELQKSYISLLYLTAGVLELVIDKLGFSAPSRM